MLHVSGLRRGGLDEQPLEEAVALERCRRDTLALLGEADVVADIWTRPVAARFESAFVTLGLERPRRSAMLTLRYDPRRRRITRMASR